MKNLARKCEALERYQQKSRDREVKKDTEPNENRIIEIPAGAFVREEGDHSHRTDACVQTDLDVIEVPRYTSNDKVPISKEQAGDLKEVQRGLAETKQENPGINFGLDDLVLDNNFVPWQKKTGDDLPEKLPKLDLNSKTVGKKTRRTLSHSTNSCAISSGEHRRLLNTVR